MFTVIISIKYILAFFMLKEITSGCKQLDISYFKKLDFNNLIEPVQLHLSQRTCDTLFSFCRFYNILNFYCSISSSTDRI